MPGALRTEVQTLDETRVRSQVRDSAPVQSRPSDVPDPDLLAVGGGQDVAADALPAGL